MYINEGKVYVFQNEIGLVKIGCSKNVSKRKKTLETQSGKRAIGFYCTSGCSNQYKVEQVAHRTLKKCRVEGEWFKCDFETAVQAVNDAFLSTAEFDFISKEKADEDAKNSAKEFVKKFYPDLFSDDTDPKDKLDLDKWEPSDVDKEPILAFLLNWYKGTLEAAGPEEAEEYISLYNEVIGKGIPACKDKIQGVLCDIFWAVDGEIEEYYKGDEDLIKMMNLTILKTPVA